jgi:hypothetical protein
MSDFFQPYRNLSPSIRSNFPTMSDFFQPYGNIFSRFPPLSVVIFQLCQTLHPSNFVFPLNSASHSCIQIYTTNLITFCWCWCNPKMEDKK